jgi:hypothetical protein
MSAATYIADLVLVVVVCVCAGLVAASAVLWIFLGGVWPFAVFIGAAVCGGLAALAR